MSWLATQQDAIVAGIVSSWIVLSLQVAVGVSVRLLYDAFRGQQSLRRILRFKEPRRIYVISGNIEELAKESYEGMVLLAAPDAEAAVNIKATLQTLYPKCDVIHTFCSSVSDEMFQHDLVCVGGPVNNSASRLLLSEMAQADADVPKFESHEIVAGENRYSCSREGPENRVTADYGFLLVDDNPFNEASRCVIVAGCDTNGVLAAASFLGLGLPRRRLFKSLRRKFALRLWTFTGGPIKRLCLITRTRAVGTLGGEAAPVDLQIVRRRSR